MGIRGGRRSISDIKEPSLLGDIDDIIKNADKDGYIKGNKIDIESIIRQHNITVERIDLASNISGRLLKRNGKWIIEVNRNHHRHRQRYTLAHEFAHFCLHKSDNDDFFEDEIFFRDENQTSIEFAANSFAAKLLMPDELILAAIKSGTNSLKELAEMFDVSTLAIRNRVVGLGYQIENYE